jgi:HEAT repeat protein
VEDAVEEICRSGDTRAVENMLVWLRDRSGNLRSRGLIRITAARALGGLRDRAAVPALIAALQDPDAAVRAAAAESLGQIGDRRATEPLIAMVADADDRTGHSAVAALRILADQGAVGSLIARLKDDCGQARLSASDLLGGLGDRRAVEPLIARLKDDCGSVRATAAASLGRLGDTRAVEPLIAVLDDNAAGHDAAEALGRLGDPRAIDPLVRRLASADRMAAAVALAQMGELCWQEWVKGSHEDFARLAGSGHPRAAEIVALAADPLIDELIYAEANPYQTGDEWVPYLDQYVPTGKEPSGVPRDERDAIRKALTGLGPGIAALPIARRLPTLAPDRQASAAGLLEEMGAGPALEPLMGMLPSLHPLARLRVVEALAKSNDPRVVGPIIARLCDEDWRVRSGAARALGRLADPASVGPLQTRLGDADSSVRESAAEALGSLKNPSAVEALVRRLSDSESRVRAAAAVALGRLGDLRAVDPLIGCLTDSAIRRRVAESLGILGDRRAAVHLVKYLNDDSAVGASTAIKDVIGRLADAATVEPLIARLTDYTAGPHAVELLGRTGDARAVGPLISLLQDQHERPSMHCKAADSLALLADPRAVEPLTRCLMHGGPSVRLAAIAALARLGDPRAIDSLLRLRDQRHSGRYSYDPDEARTQRAEQLEAVRNALAALTPPARPSLAVLFRGANDDATHAQCELGVPAKGPPFDRNALLAQVRDTVPEIHPPSAVTDGASPATPLAFPRTFGEWVTPPNSEYQRYNREREEYLRRMVEYFDRLAAYRAQVDRTLPLELEMRNVGTGPAEDIDLCIRFAEGSDLYLEDGIPAEPREPSPPQKPQTQLRRMADMTVSLPKRLDYMPSIPSLGPPDSFSLRKSNGYELRGHVARLKHGCSYAIRRLYLVFPSCETAKSFSFDYRIVAANLPEPATGQVHVVLQMR